MALDLTKAYPRSPFTELDGYPWLARMLDKVRAKHAGTLGAYTPYPCGGDKRFLKTLGLDPDALEAQIQSGASDEEVLAWVKAHQAPDTAEKLQAYRQFLMQPTSADRLEVLQEMVMELKAARPELHLSQVDSFYKLICAEEEHPFPSLV